MSLKHLVVFFMSFLFLGLSAEAASVKSVKGKRVVINLDGDEVSSGDKMYVMDSSGKKKGLLKIVKVSRNGKNALANLTKGKAQAGWTVSGGSSGSSSSSGGSGGIMSGLHYGVALGVSLDSMEAEITSVGKVTMSGNGFAVKGMADYVWSPSISLRAKLGLETFKVSGESGVTTYDVDIMFLAAEGMARYIFSSGKYQFWAGAGGALFNAMSQKTSNAIQKIGTTGAWQIGGGLDYKLSAGKYIPIELLYSNLPSSASAKASYISILVGYVF